MFVTKVEDAYQETEVNTSYRGEGEGHEVMVPFEVLRVSYQHSPFIIYLVLPNIYGR